MIQFSSLPPLSLYIHFPWCVKKCPYCDFNSHQQQSDFNEELYIDALLKDAERALPNIWGRSIQSIFMGGGTPSLFSPDSMDRLLSQLRALFTVRPDIEVTMEANPGSIDVGQSKEKFSEFKDAGINRLSIGVQSFNNTFLKTLGRVHDSSQAISAIESAHSAGFNSINIDLMYGLPAQTVAQSNHDIQQAIQLEVDHISHYQLTIEANTLFHKHPPSLPSDDICWQMQTQNQRLLAQANFMQYEVSAYAQPHSQCKHNLNYWKFGDYLGIGAGAHSKISNASSQSICRDWKLKNPRDYLEKISSGNAISGTQILTRNDIGLEFIMNALRLSDGFEIETFIRHTGCQISLIDDALIEAEHKELITRNTKSITPTAHGKRYLNDLMTIFVP